MVSAMKAKEYRDNIRNMTLEELKKEEQELKSELFKLRFKHATGTVENPMRLKFIKRDIARVKTIIKEKELAAAADK